MIQLIILIIGIVYACAPKLLISKKKISNMDEEQVNKIIKRVRLCGIIISIISILDILRPFIL